MDGEFEDALADSIVEANAEITTQKMVGGHLVLETDEFGFDRTEKNKAHFLVARTLALDDRRKQGIAAKGERVPLGYYHHKGKLYHDHQLVEESDREIMRRADWYGAIKKHEAVEYWANMLKFTPRLCTRYMEVGGDLFFDMQTCSLVHRKDLDETAE